MSTSALRRSAITPPIATTTEFTVENKNGYSILRLNKAPVNSLSLEFLTAFGIELDKLEDNKSINGVILTSVSLPFAFNFDNL
jgi:3,2-trans-enoyl-CoA isomerase